jgi:hypothetical protein
MGYTSLYHPVSLPLLRHTLRAAGIDPSTVKQMLSDEDASYAVYNVTVRSFTLNPLMDVHLSVREAYQLCIEKLNSGLQPQGFYLAAAKLSWRANYWRFVLRVCLMEEMP